jgi:tetratricopeptide (TPR) repeat protein
MRRRPDNRRRPSPGARRAATAGAIVLALAAQLAPAGQTPSAEPATPADALPAPEAEQQPAPLNDSPAGIPVGFLEGSTGEFRRLLAAREYAQAVATAQELLGTAERQPGPDGEYLQVALMNLALAQYLDEDYTGAEASYLRVVELIEDSGRLTSPRLARAQAGLATTYYAAKRYDLAVARYETAIALVRREQGLFTEQQIPFLEKYADSLVHVGRANDAVRARRYILRAIERTYGADSLRYGQEFESIGRWFTRIGAYDPARASLLNSIRIIEAAKGEDAAELIGPLTGLADCARRQLLDPSYARATAADDQRQSLFHDTLPPVLPSMSPGTIANEGQSALNRAVAIAIAQVPPSPVQVADVRTLLGDWYQSRRKEEDGLSNYQLAWRAAGDSTVDGRPLTELLFGRPVQLVYTPPGSWDRYAGRPEDEVVVRVAVLDLTIAADGHVAETKVLSDGGNPKFGEQLQRAAEAAIYRPRLENGTPVATPGVTLEQPFYALIENEPGG